LGVPGGWRRADGALLPPEARPEAAAASTEPIVTQLGRNRCYVDERHSTCAIRRQKLRLIVAASIAAAEGLETTELEHEDPDYRMVICVRAVRAD
jgi:hypothetical protein